MKVPSNLVSRKQAFKLYELGYNEPASWLMFSSLETKPLHGKRFNALQWSQPIDWNNSSYNEKERRFISVPTVYEALDWIACALEKDKNVGAWDYIGYVYLDINRVTRYSELRKLIDAKLKLLISSRKRSAKSKKRRLSKS